MSVHEPRGLAKAVARILSVLFHPGFLPFYFLIAYSANKSHRVYILAVAFLLLVGLPLLGTVLYLRTKGVKDYYTVERKHRFALFGFHAVGIAVLWAAMQYGLQGYLPAWWIPAVFLFNALGFGVTLWWKISLHMMGMSAMLGIMLAYSSVFPAYLWLIVPALMVSIGWARVYLRSHDGWQIAAGTLLGVIYWWSCCWIWG